jgi:hypothetical protein
VRDLIVGWSTETFSGKYGNGKTGRISIIRTAQRGTNGNKTGETRDSRCDHGNEKKHSGWQGVVPFGRGT